MNLENKLLLETYKEIIEKIPYGIIITNNKGEVIFCNSVTEKILSKNIFKKDWLKNMEIFTTNKDSKFSTEENPLVRALNGEIISGERLYIKKEEEEIYIKISAYPIYEKDNKTISLVIIIFEDVTKEQILYDSVINKINELELYLKDLITLKQDFAL